MFKTHLLNECWECELPDACDIAWPRTLPIPIPIPIPPTLRGLLALSIDAKDPILTFHINSKILKRLERDTQDIAVLHFRNHFYSFIHRIIIVKGALYHSMNSQFR